jgi:hypothetical protein
MAFCVVRRSAFSASPNLTIAVGRRKQQGAPASAVAPYAQTATRSAARQQAAAYSAVSTPLLFVPILSQSKQLQIFFVLSEFQFQFPSI